MTSLLSVAVEDAEHDDDLPQRLFRRVADASPHIIYIYDLEKRRNVYSNRRSEEVLGYPRGTLQRMGASVLTELLHPNDAKRIFAIHARLPQMPDGAVAMLEYRMRHASGEWRNMRSREIALTRTRDGRVTQILGVAEDITDQKRSISQLRYSERRFRTVADAVPGILFVTDLEFRCSYVNRNFTEVTGLPTAAALGFGYRDAIHPDDLARLGRPLAELGSAVETELRIRDRDGNYRWFQQRISQLPPHGDESMRWFGVATDIHELKGAAEALRQSNEKFQGILSSISDAFITIARDWRIVEVNDAAGRWLDLPRENLLGRRFQDLFPAKPRIQGLVRAFNGEAAPPYEFASMIRPGRWVEVSTYLSPPGVSLIIRDITERKAAESALRRLAGKVLRSQDDERRRIARELHDSPAQNLVGASLTLVRARRLVSQPGATAEALKAIEEAQELIEQSLRDIRTVAYLLHPPALSEAGLPSVLRWFVKGFVERSGIAVELELADEMPRFDDDVETALFRIVQESLTNVHRHSGSEVATIRLDRRDDRIYLEVVDFGRGMGTDRSGGEQFGVGIAGMRERLHQLGGELGIESGPTGTTVRVNVPAQRAGR